MQYVNGEWVKYIADNVLSKFYIRGLGVGPMIWNSISLTVRDLLQTFMMFFNWLKTKKFVRTYGELSLAPSW